MALQTPPHQISYGAFENTLNHVKIWMPHDLMGTFQSIILGLNGGVAIKTDDVFKYCQVKKVQKMIC